MVKTLINADTKWLHEPNFQFYLTDACQLSCEYCFRKEKRALDHYFNLKIDKNDIRHLKQLLRTINFNCSFTLIGGEPTMILNFEELCNEILDSNEKIKIKIYTNLEKSLNYFSKLNFIDNSRVIYNITYHNMNKNNIVEKLEKYEYIINQKYYSTSINQLILDNDEFYNKFMQSLDIWTDYNLLSYLNMRYLFNNTSNTFHKYSNKNVLSLIHNMSMYDMYIYKFLINDEYIIDEWELLYNKKLNNFSGCHCNNNSFASSYLKTGQFFMNEWEHVCLEHSFCNILTCNKNIKYNKCNTLADLIHFFNDNVFNIEYDVYCNNTNCFRFDLLSYKKDRRCES